MKIQFFLHITALWTLAFFSHAALAAEDRPTLTGIVTDLNGAPVKDARVFIYTANPKEGPGVLCPSCYADCTKRATSDADGKFSIESLDPKLLFRVLVVGKGHRPEFMAGVDPAKNPISVSLKPVAEVDSPKKRMRGRVLNAADKPVSGAVVSIRGVTRGTGTRFGGNDLVDPLAVTDDGGFFEIRSQEEFDAVGVDVEAPALAKAIFQSLSTGDKIHELRLNEGISVKGRVEKDGKPLSGLEIGISGADRRSEIYVGNYSVATDDEGQFLFVNLPANTEYVIYGVMDSLREQGAIPARRVRAGSTGSTLEAGTLEVVPGFVVAGKVRLADGEKIPEKTKVMVSRDEAWDSQQTDASSDGSFRFVGVPAESISVSGRIKGYRFSTRNASLDPLNPFGLIGTIASDKTNLVLEFEPGAPHSRLDGDPNALQLEPIRGAEPGSHAGDIKVQGKVVDGETGEPLPAFTVTEGRSDSFREQISWFPTRKSAHSNGNFTVYFMKQPRPPAILVEAEGYLPFSSGELPLAETNLVIELAKGAGPAGVVLGPSGEPANGIKVYLTDMKNGVYLQGEDLEVRESIFPGTKHTMTDEKGRFSFAPQIDAYSLMVVNDRGFAHVTLDQLSKTPEIRLQPWARLDGELKIGSKPGAGESIRLGLAHIPYEHHPRHFSPLQLYLNTKTDEHGKFAFKRVPPVALEVYHEPKVRDSQVGTIAKSQNEYLIPSPGETSHVTLGGIGHPVVGRIVVNGYDGEIDWRSDVYSLVADLPDPPELPNRQQFTENIIAKLRTTTDGKKKEALLAELKQKQEEFNVKTREFYQTEQGLRHSFARHSYALNFCQDGRFRIEDVPAGKYNLRIDLREGGGDDFARFNAPLIASLNKEIAIPAVPGGTTTEPFDLGIIELTARNVLSAGKPVPDFETKTIDEKPLKLSDFRGKHVLLDFWAVWCGPCVAETPHLKATYDAFKDDERFAMIGLSLDPDVAAPRDYARKNNLGWIQGFLGEWTGTDIPNRFGVEGIPAIFLIGPDGKVIAGNLRGPAIKSAVEAALNNPPRQASNQAK